MHLKDLKRVVISGGTGLVGRRLAKTLAQRGVAVTILTRDPSGASVPAGVTTAGWAEATLAMDGADAVINLAGEGIADRRWSPARKQALLASRTESTQRLVAALGRCSQRPGVLINASAIGLYGGNDGAPLDENAPAGQGFLADICQAWERASETALSLGIRLVKLRIGVVLAQEGGALPKMALPVKLFQGAALGDGRQGLSWIHIDDLVGLLIEAARNPAYVGAINATAPYPVSNTRFTQLLGKALHRPILPVPAFLTRAGVRLLVGEMADEMLLTGAFVYPRRAQSLGFLFKFPSLEAALTDLIPGAPKSLLGDSTLSKAVA